MDAVKGYLHHLNLPLPPGQIKLESIVQTLLTRASAFIYAYAVGLIKGFTYFSFDLILVLFITFFMSLQGDDSINEIKQLSPLEPAHNEEILRETELTIKATFWGTVVVAFVQGALGGLGFLIFGLPQPAFWGTVMVPAAVIPLGGKRHHLGASRRLPAPQRPCGGGRGPYPLGRGACEPHRQRAQTFAGKG